MKYLIVGLGNPGYEYDGTRHNIGFRVVDALAKSANAVWEDKRYGFVANIRVKNAQLVLLKPTTFMNLSGNAVRYWLEKENIENENMLVIVDDLSLPTGTLRLRAKGSDGGHNGLKSVIERLGTQDFIRLKIGVGRDRNDRSKVIGHVLGKFDRDTRALMDSKIVPAAVKAVEQIFTEGPDAAMNVWNGWSAVEA